VAWVIAAGSFTLTGAQANPSVTFGLMFQGLAPNQGVSLIVAQVFGLLVTLLLLMFFAPAKRKRAATRKK
jgi:glycerol uptake facilitator-like aquaporin